MKREKKLLQQKTGIKKRTHMSRFSDAGSLRISLSGTDRKATSVAKGKWRDAGVDACGARRLSAESVPGEIDTLRNSNQTGAE